MAEQQDTSPSERIALQGTPKQVAWAERIRAEALANLDGKLDAETIAPLLTVSSASWWIDNRDFCGRYSASIEIVRRAQRHLGGDVTQDDAEDDAEDEPPVTCPVCLERGRDRRPYRAGGLLRVRDGHALHVFDRTSVRLCLAARHEDA